MKSFSRLLKEADEKAKDKVEDEELPEEEETIPEEDTEELPPSDDEEAEEGESLEDEFPEEEEPTEEVEESGLVSDTKDLIDSVLDALEADMLASGETVQEGESIDLGLELISKFADQIPEEILQQIYDEISTYYEVEVDENAEEEPEEEPEEEEEFFEEPPTEEEEVAPEEVKVESIKPKVINRKSLKKLTEDKQPHGIFHGSARGNSYTFYGDNNQQITIKRKHNMTLDLQSKMTAEELLKLKEDSTIIFDYYPRGKLF
jgi:hypothetical protein